MRSEPPTPTRAPDNQFRQMQHYLHYIRNTNLLNFWVWVGGSYSIDEDAGPGRETGTETSKTASAPDFPTPPPVGGDLVVVVVVVLVVLVV